MVVYPLVLSRGKQRLAFSRQDSREPNRQTHKTNKLICHIRDSLFYPSVTRRIIITPTPNQARLTRTKPPAHKTLGGGALGFGGGGGNSDWPFS